MKRLLSILILLVFIFSFSACQTDQGEDLNPPYFLGLKDVSYQIGDEKPIVLDGVLAMDQEDGELTTHIVVDDSSVKWNLPGVYPLFYTIVDEAGNDNTASILITITAAPIIDTTAPVITGLTDLEYTIGQNLPDLLNRVKAQDDIEGNLTSQIIIDDSSVDYNLPGAYSITYTVSDSKDNSIESFRKITVVEPTVPIEDVTLNIYYINDTHGAIESYNNQLGLSSIANLVVDEKTNHPDTTLFIGGGDLLQGNILSNYYFGSSMIDILNVMQMDAFVLGNHEFDWGIETVLRYRDSSSEQIQANFPFLGANIFLKNTTQRPDFIDAYQIVRKGRLKIGIIGLMGYGLEGSIATSRIQDYEFADPIYWAEHYATYLREEEQVDIVLAVVHGNNSTTNSGIATLTGNSRVDAIFNGHSHSRYTQTISRPGVDVPVIQSKANGEYVGKVTLVVGEGGNVKSFDHVNLHPYHSSSSSYDKIAVDSRLIGTHFEVTSLIEEYKLAISDLLTKVIIKSDQSYDVEQLSSYMAEIIRLSANADIGIHNYGGTRASLSSNQDITIATLYQIFPFDNKVKHVYVSGSDIKNFVNSEVAVRYKPGLSLDSLVDDVYYKVATNDYIFDDVEYPFISGVDPTDTGYLIRDLLEDILREQAKTYPTFRIDRPIIFTQINYSDLRKQFYI